MSKPKRKNRKSGAAVRSSELVRRVDNDLKWALSDSEAALLAITHVTNPMDIKGILIDLQAGIVCVMSKLGVQPRD